MTAPAAAVLTSNIELWQKDHLAAVDAGLLAVAEFLALEIQQRLRQGFTSGEFTPDEDIRFPGTVADSVVISPITTKDGARVIRVGSTSGLTVIWEMGHLNVFTDRFERVPIWKATAVQNAHRMATIFGGVYHRKMARWKGAA